jgi:putative proteasome-type protease
MTCCIAIRLDSGLVFLADSRTNAGVDNVSTFRKLRVFEKPGDRVIVLMSAGNLSISQSVLQMLTEQIANQKLHIWSAHSLYQVAELVGMAVRDVHKRDAQTLEQFNVEFNASFIVGGQLGNEPCRLFHVYSAGNFIEAEKESPYFHIGDGKFAKPFLSTLLDFDYDLNEATKSALIAMDATLRLNLSVGMPLDLLVYEAGSLAVTRYKRIEEHDAYFHSLRRKWAEQMKAALHEVDNPDWSTGSCSPADTMPAASSSTASLRILPPLESVSSNEVPGDQMAAQNAMLGAPK